jgi:hypothetical protein
MLRRTVGLLLLMGMNLARAQAPASAPAIPSPEAAVAAPTDVASPEAIIQAVYAVISGPKGAAHDWPRLRSLMVPGGIFAVTGTAKGGALRTRVITLEDYISGSSKAMAEEGFYEHGVISSIWRYGHVAAVRSPYESRHAPGEAPFQRGINSFQLSYDGARWWIVSISWEGETPAFPLPAAEDTLLRGK